MVAFEPEEESPIVFLRINKNFKKRGLKVTSVATKGSIAMDKLKADFIKVAPGAEAAAVAGLTLTAKSVILVGERASESAGLISAAVALAEKSGAKLAWISRRAGERGALEAGAFPTSYIPTTTAAATRAADVPVMTGQNLTSWLNNGAGTVYSECLQNYGNGYIYAFSDNTGNNRWQTDVTNNTVSVYCAVDGSAQATFNAGTSTNGTAFRLASAYKVNDLAATVNAGGIGVDSDSLIPVITYAYFGTSADGSSSSQLNGWMKKFAYYPQRLTNTQLTALTS